MIGFQYNGYLNGKKLKKKVLESLNTIYLRSTYQIISIMKFTFALLCLIIIAQGCTNADKVKCVAAMVGCGAICGCDIPVCECCPECLACVTATVADCCDCLFPGWSGCTDTRPTLTCARTICYDKNQSICCSEDKSATCACPKQDYGNSTCTCGKYTDIKNEGCSHISCAQGTTKKCCPVGTEASCQCINGVSSCTCQTIIKGEACANVYCKHDTAAICCPTGQQAKCVCPNGYAFCGCS